MKYFLFSLPQVGSENLLGSVFFKKKNLSFSCNEIYNGQASTQTPLRSAQCLSREGRGWKGQTPPPSTGKCHTTSSRLARGRAKNTPPSNFGPCVSWLRSPQVGAGAWWWVQAFFWLVSTGPNHPYSFQQHRKLQEDGADGKALFNGQSSVCRCQVLLSN